MMERRVYTPRRRAGRLGRAAGDAALVLVLSLALLWPVPGQPGCESARVEVQVLGSGGPELTDARASSGYLVRLDGAAIVLVDAGSGSALRFEQSGADFAEVEALLLTHLHTDHSADFPAYIKGSYFTSRTQDLRVLGPEAGGVYPSTSAFVRAMIGAAAPSAYPYLNDYLDPALPADYKAQVTDVPATGKEVWRGFETDRYRLSAVPVHHGPVPALAWRIDLAGCGVVFTGDMSGRYGNLPRLAQGADLLVAHNAVPEEATGVARSLHMPPSVIGRLAAEAGVGRLVLSHRMERTLGREQETARRIREHYRGPLDFADDLDRFSPEAPPGKAP